LEPKGERGRKIQLKNSIKNCKQKMKNRVHGEGVGRTGKKDEVYQKHLGGAKVREKRSNNIFQNTGLSAKVYFILETES